MCSSKLCQEINFYNTNSSKLCFKSEVYSPREGKVVVVGEIKLTLQRNPSADKAPVVHLSTHLTQAASKASMTTAPVSKHSPQINEIKQDQENMHSLKSVWLAQGKEDAYHQVYFRILGARRGGAHL